MHLIAEIAVLFQSVSDAGDPSPHGITQHLRDFSAFVVSHWADIAKVLVALATLLSTGGALGGRFSWLQRFIAPRRKSDLIEQISKLAESMSKVRELPEWAGEMNGEVRATLKAELETKLAELKKLQASAVPAVRAHSSGLAVKIWMKYTFLWWLPRGFGAWLIHLWYYLLVAVIGLISLGFLVEILFPAQGSHIDAGDVTIAIILYAILGVPALVLRFFAVRIYKRQCDEALRRSEPPPAQDGIVSPQQL